jgi:hypothetical protein
MIPNCTPILGVTFMQESWMFKALVEKEKNTKLSPHDTIGKVLKCRGLKCHHIVHLDLICMNYD